LNRKKIIFLLFLSFHATHPSQNPTLHAFFSHVVMFTHSLFLGCPPYSLLQHHRTAVELTPTRRPGKN